MAFQNHPRCKTWTLMIGVLIVLIIASFINPIVKAIIDFSGALFVVGGTLYYMLCAKIGPRQNSTQNNDSEKERAVTIETDLEKNGDELNGNDDIPLKEDDDDGKPTKVQTFNIAMGNLDILQKSEELISPVEKPKEKPSRLYYLDNLKSILTALVIIHHVTNSFTGIGWYYVIGNYYHSFRVLGQTIISINQSYFMCLFFFISGYFTPSSCDKKGRKGFLKDKFKRLGIPFCIYFFILGPGQMLFISTVAVRYSKPLYYSPNAGPCWFLCWLLIFNTAYTLFTDNIPIYQTVLPPIWKFILVGFLLSFIQLPIALLGSFIYMPMVWGSLPYDILFFAAGITAKRNKWLRNGIAMMSSCKVAVIRIITVLIFLGFLAFHLLDYILNLGIMMPKKDDDFTCDNDKTGNDIEWTVWMSTAWIIFFFFAGVGTMIISLAAIEFSSTYLNFTNKVTQFFASTAYSAYLIHPLIVTPITWTWVLILKKLDSPAIFCGDTGESKNPMKHDAYLWYGWVYANVLTMLLVWPFAWIVKQLPGLNKIL